MQEQHMTGVNDTSSLILYPFSLIPLPTILAPFLSFLRKQESTYFSFREKRKVSKRKATQRFQRSELLGSSLSCAHSPHARKVFEVGFGEGLFSKSPSPTKESGKPFFQKRFSLTFLVEKSKSASALQGKGQGDILMGNTRFQHSGKNFE
jgi:hypothetical protein